MSNKRYDTEHTAAISDQDVSRNHLFEEQETILLSRADRHRNSDRVSSLFSRGKKEDELAGITESSMDAEEEEAAAIASSNADRAEGQEKKKSPFWARALLWILRKSIAPIIMIIMLVAGLYIGYVILGGQPKEDVFQFSTWKHMWDLIFAES